MSNAKIAPIFAQAATAASKDPNVSSLVKENARLNKQVVELKAQVADLQNQLSKKRKAEGATTTSGGPPPSKKAKTPAQRKKLFEKWSKALTRLSAKAKITNPCGYGEDYYSVEVKETTPWSPDEFQTLFAGQGRKIQPTKDNKPTSQITILKFDDIAAIQQLFGEAEIKQDGYLVSLWRSRNFQKSFKMCNGKSTLKTMEVHYNKSKQTLTLKFNMNCNY